MASNYLNLFILQKWIKNHIVFCCIEICRTKFGPQMAEISEDNHRAIINSRQYESFKLAKRGLEPKCHEDMIFGD